MKNDKVKIILEASDDKVETIMIHGSNINIRAGLSILLEQLAEVEGISSVELLEDFLEVHKTVANNESSKDIQKGIEDFANWLNKNNFNI